jgi:hypothetical protein
MSQGEATNSATAGVAPLAAAPAAVAAPVHADADPPPSPTTTRGERFLKRVDDALANLIEVKVVTIVGDVTVKLTAEHDGRTTQTIIGDITIDKGAITSIFKVIDGDMTMTISPELLGNTDLLAKHEAQLDKSLKVLPDHLKTLVEIAKNLKDAF